MLSIHFNSSIKICSYWRQIINLFWLSSLQRIVTVNRQIFRVCQQSNNGLVRKLQGVRENLLIDVEWIEKYLSFFPASGIVDSKQA